MLSISDSELKIKSKFIFVPLCPSLSTELSENMYNYHNTNPISILVTFEILKIKLNVLFPASN